ncbi:MAG TPA: S8 family serine peptidase [Caulobacteraceae bacterium]|jgi:subtilisin family serine protease
MMKILFAGVSVATLAAASQAMAGSNYSTAWQAQIANTATVQTSANGGAGVTVGVVDTGVVAANPEISGHVSAASSCAAVTFKCSNGVVDDNGHGTAVAAILGGRFTATSPISMSGVAPNVTIVAEKVLSAAGSGSDADVANGITKATQAGAKVINLSLTYLPTPSVVAAVNYAAANGVTIVWAGGNSSAALNGGVTSQGFTAAAASHIIFVGAVGSNNALASFSNTPGAGGLKVGTTTVSYASLWLMAPGQNIAAPAIEYGASSYAYWTGTSMSAPEVSGAAALLDATWPVLVRNGTTSAVLFKTATSLGSASTYGDGLLNLNKAFQPIGVLTVTEANGASLPVTSLTGSTISGGALGSLATVKAELSKYTAFDTYQRNFLVNLSGLITTSSTSLNSSIVGTPPINTTVAGVTGGKFMLVGLANDPAAAQAPASVSSSLTGQRTADPSYFAFAGNDGTFWAIGQGVPATLGFAQAAWGAESPAAEQTGNLGVTGALANLAQGGRSATIGEPMGRFRVAASFSSSATPVGSIEPTDRNRTDASATSIAVTSKINSRWSVGATFSSLKEQNALLGTTYDGAGALSLGDRHQSELIGISSAFDLGGGRALLAEASSVTTDGADMQSGLIQSVSGLKATAWGVSLIQSNALKAGDSLTVSVRQPLRVTSGTAQMAVTSVDDEGYANTTLTPMSLAPNAHETDLMLGYVAPVGQQASFRGGFSVRSDAQNVAGLTAFDLNFGMNVVF